MNRWWSRSGFIPYEYQPESAPAKYHNYLDVFICCRNGMVSNDQWTSGPCNASEYNGDEMVAKNSY